MFLKMSGPGNAIGVGTDHDVIVNLIFFKHVFYKVFNRHVAGLESHERLIKESFYLAAVRVD